MAMALLDFWFLFLSGFWFLGFLFSEILSGFWLGLGLGWVFPPVSRLLSISLFDLLFDLPPSL